MTQLMKDSGIEWIGEIPENWRTCKIKDVFDVVSGATPKSEQPEYWDGDIVWVTPADYKTNDKFITFGKRTITQAGYDSCGTTLIPAGSIVFSKRAPIGSVAIAQVPLCTNQGCLSCINKGEADTTFFYYVMSIFTEIFELYGSGTTFKELSYDSFAAFAMTNPPISEQRRIADFLDRRCAEIDAVIERTKATIEEYKKLKQAVVTEAVTKGVRGPRPMKDSGIEWIGEIPEEWDWIFLKYVTAFQEGPGIMGDAFISEGVPLIRISGMKGDTVSLDGCNYLDPDTVMAKWNHFRLQRGDVVISASASMGMAALVDETTVGCIPYTGLIRFPMTDKLNNMFLKYFLISNLYMEQINVQKTGSTIQHYGPTHIAKVKIALPNRAEQDEIATYLDEKCAALDTLIAKKTALFTELETYKKSLIYEYVTGKKEVL